MKDLLKVVLRSARKNKTVITTTSAINGIAHHAARELIEGRFIRFCMPVAAAAPGRRVARWSFASWTAILISTGAPFFVQHQRQYGIVARTTMTVVADEAAIEYFPRHSEVNLYRNYCSDPALCNAATSRALSALSNTATSSMRPV